MRTHTSQEHIILWEFRHKFLNIVQILTRSVTSAPVLPLLDFSQCDCQIFFSQGFPDSDHGLYSLVSVNKSLNFEISVLFELPAAYVSILSCTWSHLLPSVSTLQFSPFLTLFSSLDHSVPKLSAFHFFAPFSIHYLLICAFHTYSIVLTGSNNYWLNLKLNLIHFTQVLPTPQFIHCRLYFHRHFLSSGLHYHGCNFSFLPPLCLTLLCSFSLTSPHPFPPLCCGQR